MSKIKKLIMGLGIAFTTCMIAVVGLVLVPKAPETNKPSDVVQSTTAKPKKPTSYTYKAEDISLQRGGNTISYNYSPTSNMKDTPKVVAYEYMFGNTMHRTAGVNIKSINTTDVKITYAWSSTGRLNLEDDSITTYTKFELQELEGYGSVVYLYIFIAPNDGMESIPASYTTDVVWWYGIPTQLPIVNNVTNTIVYQPVITNQPIDKNTLSTPESFVKDEDGTEVTYYFDGWFLDENYTQLVEAEDVKPNKQIYAKFANFPKYTTDYTTFENGGYTITSDPELSNLVVPTIYNDGINGDAPIGSIGRGLSGNYNLFSINLRGCTGLTSISSGAFEGCESLINVDLGGCTSLTTIGDSAFQECSGLTSITIPASVTSIGEYAFQDCYGLTSVDLSKCTSLTSIEDGAFSCCESLTNITIPASVTSIGEYAFEYCIGLTSIVVESGNPVYDSRNNCNALIETSTNTLIQGCNNTVIPNDITSIGEYAFSYCESLTSIDLSSCTSLRTTGDYAFSCCYDLTSITLPSSLTTIGERAFQDCYGLTSVDLSKCTSLTSIGSYAFYGCDKLTSIEIPASVTKIGCSVFTYCSILTSLTFKSSDTWCRGTPTEQNNMSGGTQYTIIAGEDYTSIFLDNTIQDYDYWYKLPANLPSDWMAYDSATSSYYVTNGTSTLPADLVIPAIYNDGTNGEHYITSIGESAFYECGGLTSITLPSSVTSIGEYAFYYCSGLTSITLPSSVTSIGNYAFSDCESLTSIDLPESLTSIGEEAFYYCYELTSITIPANVTSIGSSAFSQCINLISMVVESGNPVYDSRNNCNAIIETATNTLTHGCKTTVIPNDITSIGSSAFEGCGSLTSITLPSSVTSIGEYAFYYCSGLTSITLPSSVTSIGNYAFSDCESLTSIDLPESLTSIGEEAFYYCYELTSITIPANVTSIGSSAFSQCINLISMVVESGNPVYDSRNNCNAIIETATNTLTHGCKTTVIPNTVTSIGEDAFEYCESLTSIDLSKCTSLTSIGNFAFSGCSGLTSVDLSGCTSLTSIEDGAFYYCESLTSITLPSSLTSIGEDAFFGCSKLTSITIPASVTKIGSYAFYGCNSLTSLTFEVDGTWYYGTGVQQNNMSGGTKFEIVAGTDYKSTFTSGSTYSKFWYKAS